jgi:hypothetical protein
MVPVLQKWQTEEYYIYKLFIFLELFLKSPRDKNAHFYYKVYSTFFWKSRKSAISQPTSTASINFRNDFLLWIWLSSINEYTNLAINQQIHGFKWLYNVKSL